MAKTKKKSSKATTLPDTNEVFRIEVTGASLHDEKCNYKYRIVSGVGKGSTHTVNGVGIVDPDMIEAFKALNVHLAVMDDAFDAAGIPVEDLSEIDNTPLSENYSVNAFEVKGKDESQAIVLIGDKYLKRSSKRMQLKTPNIDLWNSMYEHNGALEDAIHKCKVEVQLYMEGKYTMPKEEAIDLNQTSILDGTASAEEQEAAAATFEGSEA